MLSKDKPLATIMKRTTSFIIAIIVLGIISFGVYLFIQKNESGILTEWDLDNTREIYQDDEALINSKILTQKNLAYFISEFKIKNEAEDEFYVKVRMTEDDKSEHMWLNILKLDGNQSIGLLDNVPLKFKKLKYLDTVKFDINKAEDLMLYRSDSLILGGFLLSESQKK